jgi:hypothetical protein
MPRNRWGMIETRFLTTSDGHVVFFPFGPLIGYLLPSTASSSLTAKLVFRFEMLLWFVLLFAIAISALLNIRFELAFWLLFTPTYLLYVVFIRRLTRTFTRLSLRASAVTYAATVDPQVLSDTLTGFIILTVMFTLLAVLMPPSVWFGACLFPLISLIAVYAYIVRLVPHT